ncbi:tumor necrosis factor receptor superfamily member 3-like [Ptychodera flava]|uniref:tumor necrosis factor receptor superfamily member 3-like n=1 Tax=Ptychodera flava TaxID=63121 RepID=UPI00396A12FA
MWFDTVITEHRIKVVVMVTAVLLQNYMISSLTCNGRTRYKSWDTDGNPVCTPCSKCPPGTGVSKACDETHDTQCEVCVDNTYSASWSRLSPCQPCLVCDPHQQTTKNCTSTHSAKCTDNCDYGYFMNKLTDECDRCSSCTLRGSDYSPPRMPECVSQGMPDELQCMPVRSSKLKLNHLSLENVKVPEASSTKASEGTIAFVAQTVRASAKTDGNANDRKHVHTISALAAIFSVVILFLVLIFTKRAVCVKTKKYQQSRKYLDKVPLTDSSNEETFL